MTDRPTLPVDFESWSDEEKNEWYKKERDFVQAKNQRKVTHENRQKVFENRSEYTFCTNCGSSVSAATEAELNYCDQCGTKL